MRYIVVACVGFLALCALVLFEAKTSRLQSVAISRYATGIEHWLDAGPNPRLRYPERGPFDLRAGYSDLPALLTRLDRNGFAVTAQARVSPRYERTIADGLFPIYTEKKQAGLDILDRDGRTIFAYRYPERVLTEFATIPSVLVRSLLELENGELLDPERPYLNPAVEWDRLAMMALRLGRRSLGDDGAVQGASTLATQIEKFRHSPGGLTQTAEEKFRQMASASVRAYRDGPKTLAAQQRIVVDYLNGMPLAAMPNRGEIHGLLDGLFFWYGIDRAEIELLHEPISSERLPRAAYVYRAALSLILATRRPAFYLLGDGNEELERLCDLYATLLERRGVISEPLGSAVRELRLVRRQGGGPLRHSQLFEQKAVNAIRADLLSLVGAENLYSLDRLDLSVSTTIDNDVQRNVARELRELHDPEHRAAAGLTGPRLLPAQGSLPVTYSILLCEATAEGNLVRVQTDSLAGPLDVNRHTKLELGSTAKLRTLVSYLEIVEELHAQLAGASSEALASYRRQVDDPLTTWALDVLVRIPTLPLDELLAAALARRYSANPAERFFTGGGLHAFQNFDDAFNTSMLTVQEAFNESVNLVFIRLMRDVVRYHEQRIPFARNLTEDAGHPLRTTYLSRFANQEGQQFIKRFHASHSGLAPVDSIDRLLGRKESPALRVARAHFAVLPNSPLEAFDEFVRGRVGREISQAEVAAIRHRVQSERPSLADLAYLLDVHPLELWVAQYLAQDHQASLSQTLRAADEALQEAYRWLFRTSRKGLQDARIRTALEVEAFAKIHDGWRRVGYPFPFLVPSYATAIGSSGDSPEALAQLVGILVNEGARRSLVRVTGLRFAADTPFETQLARAPGGAAQVLSPAVAHATKTALLGVVADGTARRIRDVFTASDGTPLPMGAKTGTGDNRHVIVDRRGERVASYARNRTATMVFFVGAYFGVVTAHVEGTPAGDFTFTSALPAQLLRHLAPMLESLVQREQSAPLSADAQPRSLHTF